MTGFRVSHQRLTTSGENVLVVEQWDGPRKTSSVYISIGQLDVFMEWVTRIADQVKQQDAWGRCPHCSAMVMEGLQCWNAAARSGGRKR